VDEIIRNNRRILVVYDVNFVLLLARSEDAPEA
jgi:hypothetical protein